MKFGKLNCRGKTDPKFPADAGFLCINTCMSAALLRDMITGAQCISMKPILKETVKRGDTLILLLFGAA
jgi:hypothetical protein